MPQHAITRALRPRTWWAVVNATGLAGMPCLAGSRRRDAEQLADQNEVPVRVLVSPAPSKCERHALWVLQNHLRRMAGTPRHPEARNAAMLLSLYGTAADRKTFAKGDR